MGSREFTRGRRIVASLDYGADLLQAVGGAADAHGMAMAEFRAVGALQRARLAYYDQELKTYGEFAVDEPVELLSLLGNVSRRAGATAVHAHAVLSRRDGTCMGGHVVAGCTIFACELMLQELVGEPLARGYDAQTGLPLWQDMKEGGVGRGT